MDSYLENCLNLSSSPEEETKVETDLATVGSGNDKFFEPSELSSTTSSTRDKNYEKVHAKFQKSYRFREWLLALLDKVLKYFRKSKEMTSLSYVKGIENLVTQNFGKLEKSLNRQIKTSEKDNYFHYILQFLTQSLITRGQFLEYWVQQEEIGEENSIENSLRVTIDFEKFQKVIHSYKEDANKVRANELELVDDPNIYS